MAPTTYATVLAKNIRAARSRADISQEALATRMRALGYKEWLYQTVGKVERGNRRVTGEEIRGLAWCLETSIAALVKPTQDDKFIEFPSGATIDVVSDRRSADGVNDGAVRWSGNDPVFPGPPVTRADAAAWLQGLDAETRAQFEQVRSAVRTQEEQSAERPIPVEEALQQPVATAIVTSEFGVLVGRRNDGTPPWTFISGEVEPGESPADAAVREVKEETGVRVETAEVIGERVHPRTGRTMIYLAARPTHGTDAFVGDEDELAEVRWVSLAEADELMAEYGMFEPVHEYLQRKIGGAGQL